MTNTTASRSLLLVGLFMVLLPMVVSLCGEGQRMASETNQTCIPCPNRTYMDEQDHTNIQCRLCDKPDLFRHEVQIHPCTNTRNTVIGCKTGWCRDGDDCSRCASSKTTTTPLTTPSPKTTTSTTTMMSTSQSGTVSDSTVKLTTLTTSTSAPTESARPSNEGPDDDNNIDLGLGLGLGLGVPIVVIIIVLVVCRKLKRDRKMKEYHKTSNGVV